jgi:hypothetical protein
MLVTIWPKSIPPGRLGLTNSGNGTAPTATPRVGSGRCQGDFRRLTTRSLPRSEPDDPPSAFGPPQASAGWCVFLGRTQTAEPAGTGGRSLFRGLLFPTSRRRTNDLAAGPRTRQPRDTGPALAEGSSVRWVGGPTVCRFRVLGFNRFAGSSVQRSGGSRVRWFRVLRFRVQGSTVRRSARFRGSRFKVQGPQATRGALGAGAGPRTTGGRSAGGVAGPRISCKPSRPFALRLT